MKKRENFPPKKLGDFFRGVVYRGTWGTCQDRGEKNFRGPEILWGNWGKCKKRGETFLGGTFGGNAKKGVEKLFEGENFPQVLGEL